MARCNPLPSPDDAMISKCMNVAVALNGCERVASLPRLPDKQDAAAPSLTESFHQLREITTEETKQRIDEWREQREKYNDEVEFLRAELQAYREALCSMAAAIQSLDLESDYYVDSRRHPTVKSKLTGVLSDVEALLAKEETPK